MTSRSPAPPPETEVPQQFQPENATMTKSGFPRLILPLVALSRRCRLFSVVRKVSVTPTSTYTPPFEIQNILTFIFGNEDNFCAIRNICLVDNADDKPFKIGSFESRKKCAKSINSDRLMLYLKIKLKKKTIEKYLN